MGGAGRVWWRRSRRLVDDFVIAPASAAVAVRGCAETGTVAVIAAAADGDAAVAAGRQAGASAAVLTSGDGASASPAALRASARYNVCSTLEDTRPHWSCCRACCFLRLRRRPTACCGTRSPINSS